MRSRIEELDEKEIYYIDLYKTLDFKYGYNLKSGGQCNGVIVSKEVRDKMSQAIKDSYTNELKEKRRQEALNYWSNIKCL